MMDRENDDFEVVEASTLPKIWPFTELKIQYKPETREDT